MIKMLTAGMFFFCPWIFFAQEIVITGKTLYADDEPLIGATICQKNSENCTFSDFNGLFHLHVNQHLEQALIVSFVGLQTVEISELDTVSGILNIKLFEDSIAYATPPSQPGGVSKFGFASFVQFDFLFKDFEAFESLLGSYNTDLMNKSLGTINFGFSGTYKRFIAGFNFGLLSAKDYDNDLVDIEFNTTQYGLHLGYNLIYSNRFVFSPMAALKWNRFRLINSDSDKRIPIQQYLFNKELDIRFNQLTGLAGWNLSYKIYSRNFFDADFWTIGIYGGYAFKLHDKPWIYSLRNRLKSNLEIDIENYNLGLYISFNVD